MDRPADATMADIHGEWLRVLDERTRKMEQNLWLAFAAVLIAAAVAFQLSKRKVPPTP
jgi:hypothetical protein